MTFVPPRLFDRDWRVAVAALPKGAAVGTTVSALDVSDFDLDFEVTKDLTAEPNKCTLKVYNLGPEIRARLEALNIYEPVTAKGKTKTTDSKAAKVGLIRVEIEAGYKSTSRSVLFRGDLRRAISTQEADMSWVTAIEGEDGGRTFTTSRITESFPAGTTHLAVVKRCLLAMGVGNGNLIEVEAILENRQYSHGTTLDGPACKELAGVLRRAKLRYSFQDGSIQFLSVGTGLRRKAALLTPESGLIGAPARNSTGLVQVTSLINPDLAVGAYVQVVASGIDETFLIDKISYTGSTYGNNWYANMELKPG